MESSYFNHKARTKKFGIILGWILLGISAAVGLAILFGYVVMLLWNWIMPEIFGLIEISYWQAVGIIILAKLLFGGFGHGGKSHSKKRHSKNCKEPRSKGFKNGFSKWKYYDKFWKEEGESAYKEYVESKSIAKDNEVEETDDKD